MNVDMVKEIIIKYLETEVCAVGRDGRWNPKLHLIRKGKRCAEIMNYSDSIFRTKEDAEDWIKRFVDAIKAIKTTGDEEANERVAEPFIEEYNALFKERTENGEIVEDTKYL